MLDFEGGSEQRRQASAVPFRLRAAVCHKRIDHRTWLRAAEVPDIGRLPVAQDAAEGLYRLVDAAYEKRSVAISSNLQPLLGRSHGRHRAVLVTAPGQFLLAIETRSCAYLLRSVRT